MWSNPGFSDLNNLHKAIKRHAKTSQDHLRCLLALKKFGNLPRIELMLDSQRSRSIQAHNEQVKKNRGILRCLIDVVSHLESQELAFRGHGESVILIMEGITLKLLRY